MPPPELILFYVLATGTLVAAAVMLLPSTGRNPIHSAIALIAAFFCLAGLYAQLSAHLLTALQIIVYAGAIMVLFTFVIMLLNLTPADMREPRFAWWKVAGGVLGLFVFGKLATVITLATGGEQPINLADPMNTPLGSVRDVGRMMYTTNLVAFELASVLLLVAAVGAVVLAKKKLDYVDAPEPSPARTHLHRNVPAGTVLPHGADADPPASHGAHH
ncbi:MAG: NADH-quinone oxidoreductase subunit J [Myxococcales bacterium]|nr:NADH-quinone oxidoreductase subunit J [Myxococcales bacterium]